ncbi:MAG: outer membrane lipoprotein-sorting protein [Natronospirillum sp.]
MKLFLTATGALALLVTLSMAVQADDSLTAREIMTKVDTRYTGDSSRADAQLILIDRRERERVRDLQMFSLEEDGVTKAITFFMSPADVAGTAYLNHDYDHQADDSWLYLPALKQVRRVAAGDRSGSFMGSDFTFSDINGTTIDWYDYEILDSNAAVDGAPAWLIEAVPKPEFAEQVADETGYDRSHQWIRKDNFVAVQSQIWVTRGNRVKYFSARDLEEIDGIWTAKQLQMVTTRNGESEHSSVLRINNIRYNEDTDPTLFTTQAMQRGTE